MAAVDASVTVLLRAWADGDRAAFDRLTPVIYGELRRLAGVAMRRERPGHTLSPTELVAEAFLRLVGGEHPAYEDRVQFFAVAARQMRRILVDHARRRTADKRGGDARPVTFDEELAFSDQPDDLCALDTALDAPAALDERTARVVELHDFGGMGHTPPLSHPLLESSSAVIEVYTELWSEAAEGAGKSALTPRIEQGLAAFRQLAFLIPIARPRAFLWHGRWAALRSRTRLAGWYLRQALEAALRFRMPFEEALAHEALASFEEARSERGRAGEHRRVAGALFERLDAQWHLTELEPAPG